MPLSWNEIKSRATAFSKEWEDEVSEDAEAKSFWDGFFNIFGINRRSPLKPIRFAARPVQSKPYSIFSVFHFQFSKICWKPFGHL